MSIHIPSSIHFVKNAYVVQLDLYPDSCRRGNDNLTYFLRGNANLVLCLEALRERVDQICSNQKAFGIYDKGCGRKDVKTWRLI